MIEMLMKTRPNDLFRRIFRKLCITPHEMCWQSSLDYKNSSIKQTTLLLNLKLKKTPRQVFLEQMEHMVPLADLIALTAPNYPEGKNGRPPFSLMTMLHTNFMQK